MNSFMMDMNCNNEGLLPVSLVFLSFINEKPCQNHEFQAAIHQLSYELKLCPVATVYDGGVRFSHYDLVDSNIECDGEIEADGHSLSGNRSLLQDLVPQVNFDLPVNAEDAQAAREVAAELIRIADDLNTIIMSQAAEGLTRKLIQSRPQSWRNLLSQSVDHLLTQVPGVHSEQLVMALTFSLVKAVCERAPPLLWGLYSVLIQYISPTRRR